MSSQVQFCENSMREPELTFFTVTFGWCLACSSLFNLVIELNFIVKLTQTYEEVTKAKENGIKLLKYF